MTSPSTPAQAEAIAASLGQGGLFLADRDGEVLAPDVPSFAAAEAALAARPCAVFGAWRGGGLLAQDPAGLPEPLRAERQADARLYAWDPLRIRQPSTAERAVCGVRLQAQVAAACDRPDIASVWLWCVYRERGSPLTVEPTVVVTGGIDLAWVLAVAGGCNQQHIAWAASEGEALRPHLAERDPSGAISDYRRIAGSPPRLRLLVHARPEV